MSNHLLVHRRKTEMVHMEAAFNDHPGARIEALKAAISDINARRIAITFFEEHAPDPGRLDMGRFEYKGVLGEYFDRRIA